MSPYGSIPRTHPALPHRLRRGGQDGTHRPVPTQRPCTSSPLPLASSAFRSKSRRSSHPTSTSSSAGKDRRVTPGTQHRRQREVKAFFSWCQRMDYVDDNPFMRVPVVRRASRRSCSPSPRKTSGMSWKNSGNCLSPLVFCRAARYVASKEGAAFSDNCGGCPRFIGLARRIKSLFVRFRLKMPSHSLA